MQVGFADLATCCSMLMTLSIYELPGISGSGGDETAMLEAAAAAALAAAADPTSGTLDLPAVPVRDLGTGTPVFVMTVSSTYCLQLSIMPTAADKPFPDELIVRGLQMLAPNGSTHTLEVIDRDQGPGSSRGHSFRALWTLGPDGLKNLSGVGLGHRGSSGSTSSGREHRQQSAGVSLLCWLKGNSSGSKNITEHSGDKVVRQKQQDYSVTADMHIYAQEPAAAADGGTEDGAEVLELPGIPYRWDKTLT